MQGPAAQLRVTLWPPQDARQAPVPQVSVAFLQLVLPVAHLSPHDALVPHCTVVFSHAIAPVQETVHACAAGHVMVESLQLASPEQTTVQLKPGGQATEGLFALHESFAAHWMVH